MGSLCCSASIRGRPNPSPYDAAIINQAGSYSALYAVKTRLSSSSSCATSKIAKKPSILSFSNLLVTLYIFVEAMPSKYHITVD